MRAGQLFEISNGSRRAVVTEQGATLAQVHWDGADLLARPDDHEDDYDYFASHGGYGQLLVPWPGRVAGGQYEFEGRSYQLPINAVSEACSIHGFARWLAWQPTESAADRVSLQCRELAMQGYPFPLLLEQRYAWEKDHLDISFMVENIGNRTAPFGYGCHPYFSAGAATIDHDSLHVPARSYLEPDGPYPTGKVLPVDGSAYDFRRPRAIGGERLDVTLTDLDRDDEGRAEVAFRTSTGDVSITCKYDEGIDFIQLYTGDTLPAGRRKGVAVEPYTCAPGAFNNGMGLAHLAPKASLKVHWTLSAA